MKRPLVYYAFSCFISCLFMLVLHENRLIGVVIATSFFAILFFTLNTRFCIINVLFFLLSIASFQIYFNINVPNSIEIRVMQKKDYYYLGDYKGRKIVLSGEVSKLKEGEKIKAIGNFQGNKEYSKGIIGKFQVSSYNSKKKDLIYFLADIRKDIFFRLEEKLGEENSAVIMALCYGDTSHLSQTQKSNFQKLGVFHAISVSGFHMAIIYKVLEYILGLKVAMLISCIYILFTGMQASTMRAFIMIFIFKSSKLVFKNYDSISSLSLAAIILLLARPYYIGDIGCTLSFLATLGILLYYKKILRFLHKLPMKLNESISITLSSQVFTIPYTAFTIQNFSAGFIWGNIFLLPLYSIIVILGNITLLVYWIKPIFEVLTMGLKFILTSVEGASYLMLKLCPDVSYLGYFEGVAFALIYFSFVMYKYKDKKYKYLPLFLLLLMLCNCYSFIPQIYYIGFNKGEGAIIKYKTRSIMVCNYDQTSAKEVIKLKEDMDVDKVISNPNTNSLVEIDDDFYIGVIPKSENYFNIVIYEGEKGFVFSNGYEGKDIENTANVYDIISFKDNTLLSNSSKQNGYEKDDNYLLYVIILNRIFKIV